MRDATRLDIYFHDDRALFLIPLYQRKYSWQQKHCQRFCGGVRVSFQRKNATENATDIATENATVKLNKTQEKIMAILHADKFATYDVIAKRLGVERTTVWRNIKKLQEIGRLRRIGGDNGGYWEEISH